MTDDKLSESFISELNRVNNIFNSFDTKMLQVKSISTTKLITYLLRKLIEVNIKSKIICLIITSLSMLRYISAIEKKYILTIVYFSAEILKLFVSR